MPWSSPRSQHHAAVARKIHLSRLFRFPEPPLIAVKLNLGELPPGVTYRHIYGAALLAGVGFTMGLFVTALAFDAPALATSARLSILAGSSLSAIAGLTVLARARQGQ
ncbi:MAG: hypothetical protein CML66_22570 [Rhodobacteraceae bacterium]|nr:hypothetical protein [Paracoccaceae bacterium]